MSKYRRSNTAIQRLYIRTQSIVQIHIHQQNMQRKLLYTKIDKEQLKYVTKNQKHWPPTIVSVS